MKREIIGIGGYDSWREYDVTDLPENMPRERAVIDAWSKISDFVKHKYRGVFENGIEIKWKHEVYGWKKFGVTPEGDAYLVTGSHGWGASDWYFHPTKTHGILAPMLRDITDTVMDWQTIKSILKQKADAEIMLYEFEV